MDSRLSNAGSPVVSSPANNCDHSAISGSASSANWFNACRPVSPPSFSIAQDYLLEVNPGPENRRPPAVANGGFGDTQLRTVPFREEGHLHGSRGRPNGPAVKINRSGWSANQPLLMREA